MSKNLVYKIWNKKYKEYMCSAKGRDLWHKKPVLTLMWFYDIKNRDQYEVHVFELTLISKYE